MSLIKLRVRISELSEVTVFVHYDQEKATLVGFKL